MSDRHQHIACNVVRDFRAQLPEPARAALHAPELALLEQLIEAALGDELRHATEALEGVVQRLRAEGRRPELGM